MDENKGWEVRRTHYMTYEEIKTYSDKKQEVVKKNLTLAEALALVREYGTEYGAFRMP